MIRIVTNAYPFPKRKGGAERKVKNFLVELESQSIKEWTESLYSLSNQGKGTEILGPKGRDIYLRDMGCFDRIPIDIHQIRFILRTGIYHACSETLFDPLQKEDLQEAFAKFCSRSLRGLKVRGLDLSMNPGIVDLFVWYHSANPKQGGFSICGSKPKCLERNDICEFYASCLFLQVR